MGTVWSEQGLAHVKDDRTETRMLKISDLSAPTCIVVEAEGAISSAEYEAFAERFEDAVKQYGRSTWSWISRGLPATQTWML